MIYGIQTGTLNTSNQFLRAFFLQRASHEAVVEMLRTSSTNLSELVIHSDLPRGQDIRIYDALRSNTRLTSLRITSCGLQHFHASLLAAGLLENTALDTLDLASNPLGDEGFSPLAETLRMTPDARDAWEQVSGWVSNAPTPRLQMRSVFDLRDQSVVFAIVRVLELSVVFACSDSETRFQSVLPFACRASDVNVWRTESSSLHFQICQFLMPRVRSAEFPIPFQAQEAWARRTSMSFMSHALHDARAQKLVHVG